MASFTPPTGGMPSPLVTHDFMRAFVGARFMYDHIAAPNGVELWPVAVADRVGSHWDLQRASGPLTVWTITLDVFRILQASVAQPDGSFVVAAPVPVAGAIIPAGARGRLQATTDDLGHHTAIPVDATVTRLAEPAEVQPVNTAPAVPVEPPPPARRVKPPAPPEPAGT